MAKKKSGAAKGPKVPKQIAGIKISKELRSAIEPVLRWSGHPLVSDILAAAVVAGAGALVAPKVGRKSGSGRKKASAESEEAGTKGAGFDLGLALAIAAGEIAARIVETYEEGEGKAARPGKARKARSGTQLDDQAKRVALARTIS